MRYIGLTGRSGTGKTVVAQCAAELGIPVIDCDLLYRSMTEKPSPFLSAISDVFGNRAAENGRLNREYLREIVFHDPQAKAGLDRLTGSFIGEFLDSLAASFSGVPFVLLDAPTLYQTGLQDRCETVIGCLSAEEDCVRRICLRDGISAEQAKLRLESQLPDAFYRERCPVILENTGTEKAFRKEAKRLLRAFAETFRG